MRIAVPTNDGITVSPHFGRSAGFLVFEIEERRIKSREMRTTRPSTRTPRGPAAITPAAAKFRATPVFFRPSPGAML